MACCVGMDELIERGYAQIDTQEHGTSKPTITFGDLYYKSCMQVEVNFCPFCGAQYPRVIQS